jgi:hypothetical protein
MPKHKPREPQSKQSRRFIEAAKELKTDPSPEAFDRLMRKVDLRKTPSKPPSKLATRRKK